MVWERCWYGTGLLERLLASSNMKMKKMNLKSEWERREEEEQLSDDDDERERRTNLVSALAEWVVIHWPPHAESFVETGLI